MRFLANPVFGRMAIALIISVAAFVFGIVLLKLLRRKIVEEDMLSDNLGGNDAQYAYSAVIQQLKQQKFELQNEQKTQQRRAKKSEYISASLMSNLPCGVLFFGPNGLVKQANSTAKQLLGYASPLGMSAEDLFRDNAGTSRDSQSRLLADAVRAGLRDQVRAEFRSSYKSASGQERDLHVVLVPLALSPDESLGLACVVSDETAAATLRDRQALHLEISAEMALELRSSLSAIRDAAERMRATDDRQSASALADDIAQETQRLEKVVGGFLAGKSDEKVLSA